MTSILNNVRIVYLTILVDSITSRLLYRFSGSYLSSIINTAKNLLSSGSIEKLSGVTNKGQSYTAICDVVLQDGYIKSIWRSRCEHPAN